MFEGEGCFGSDYADLLSRAWVGLGLLSKKFPELHTTRTFEIPACGAILATESTIETSKFYRGGEALFFRTHDELARSIKELFTRSDAELSRIAAAGQVRVTSGHHDYPAILTDSLSHPQLSIG